MCGTWSLTLREEHRLKMFENRVLRRKEVVERWRSVHNEGLHNLHPLQNIIRMIKSRSMRGAGHIESI